MSLLEVSIGLAAAAALATAVFMVYRPSDVTAAVKQEQSNLQDLSSSVEHSYGLLGSFQEVSQSRLITDRLVPASMLRGDGAMRNKWGGAVEVAPETVSSPNDAFAIAYPSVPQEACAQLASSVANSVYDIRVGGISVFAGGELSPAALATRCNNGSGANMIFVYHSGLVSGEAVAATPVTNPPPVVAPPTAPPAPPGAPVAPPVTTPIVVAPPVIVAPPPVVAPPVAPPPVVAPPGAPPVVAPPGTPVGPPAVAPPYTATCQSQLPTPNPATQTRTGTTQAQTVYCAVNQYGQLNQNRPTTDSRVVTVACPGNEPWQDPTTSYTAWALATTGSWTTTSGACAPCPAPSTDTGSQWVGTSAACPSGQSGTHTWEVAQSRSRSVTTVCPAGTTTLPAPTYGAWGAWANTGATRNNVNTCATNCVLPTPSTQTNAETRVGSQTLGCPAGQSGAITQTRNEQRTQTRTAVCPAPTGAYTWGAYSAWSAWAGTSAWATTSDTCAANCVLPTPVTQSATQSVTETRTIACPAPQTGAGINQSRTLQQQRSHTAYCPAPTGAYAWGAWSAWSTTSTGAWVETSRSCSPPVPTGVCTGRPITIGCATYDAYSGVRLSAIEINDDGPGSGFQNGEYVYCKIGFADTIDAQGYPDMDGMEYAHRLKFVGTGMDDWSSNYSQPEDTSVQVTVYARNPDGTQGPRCFGTAKVMFNWGG